MKKLLALLLVLVLGLSLTACMKTEEGVKEVLLYENPGDETEVTVNYDLNEDGEDEEIKVYLTEDYYLTIESEEAEIKLGHGEAYYICKLYAIDIDTEEKGKELVVISEEISSDMMLRILKPEGDTFSLYEFESVDAYSGESYVWDTLSVGYEPEITFADGTLKTSKRGETGMWCVEAEYTFDGEKFTEVEMEERKVVRPSYNSEWMTDLSEEDKKAMDEGYVIAYADFENNGEVPEHKDMIELKGGDIFKITKEDSEGFIFIEKKSGESGWIYMGDYSDNRYEVSEIAFYLAD